MSSSNNGKPIHLNPFNLPRSDSRASAYSQASVSQAEDQEDEKKLSYFDDGINKPDSGPPTSQQAPGRDNPAADPALYSQAAQPKDSVSSYASEQTLIGERKKSGGISALKNLRRASFSAVKATTNTLGTAAVTVVKPLSMVHGPRRGRSFIVDNAEGALSTHLLTGSSSARRGQQPAEVHPHPGEGSAHVRRSISSN